MNFGPARSYHQHPYYDTYDLSEYLTEGKNCLVFKVLNNGFKTFQLYDFKGAFNTWGGLITDEQQIDLGSKHWKLQESKDTIKLHHNSHLQLELLKIGIREKIPAG